MENIEFGCATHAGRVRDHNEDHYSAVPEIGLWIIADGMGGHQAGEIASDIVSRAVVDFVRQGSSLKEAIARSHHAVIGAGEGRKNLSGMGSTVVALQIDGLNYKIAWVGDSRAYMWDGGLKQITHDHSFVQGLIDAGKLRESEYEGRKFYIRCFHRSP